MTTRHRLRPLRHRDFAELLPEARALRRDVLRWAVGTGRRVGVDALSSVLAVKQLRAHEPLGYFDAEVVDELVWVDVFLWCNDHGLEPPGELAASLVTLIEFLSAHDGLAPGSAPMATLRAAVASVCGFEPEPEPGPGMGATMVTLHAG